MKKKSFLGGLFSLIGQTASLTGEALDVANKGIHGAANAIDRFNTVRKNCLPTKKYLDDESRLLEYIIQITESYFETEEKLADETFKKIYLELNDGVLLSLAERLAPLYHGSESLAHIKLQSIPKPLPSDDPHISTEITQYLNDLLAEHVDDLKRTKQTLKRNKKLTDAVKTSLAENGLTLLWEKLMAS